MLTPSQQGPHWVFINELGDNLGHISLLKACALAVQARGIRASFIVPDLKKASLLNLSPEQLLLQAPVNTFEQARSKNQPLTLAEGLLLRGYSQDQNLSYTIKAWRSLLTALQPNCIIYNYAPTAKLAAATLPTTKHINIGSPYCVFPDKLHLSTLPPFTANKERIEKSEQQCLDRINQALTLNQLPAIESLNSLAHYDQKYILGHPPLDCFQKRRQSEQYVGFLDQPMANQHAIWPNTSNKPKVFAYLSTQYPHLEHLINTLKNHTQCNIVLSGKGGSAFTALNSKTCSIVPHPIAIQEALDACDAVIHHGGFNLMGQTLLKRKPNLCIPLHVEQLSNCQMLATAQLGITIPPNNNWAEQAQEVVQFLEGVKKSDFKFLEGCHFKVFDAGRFIDELDKP